MILCPLDAWLGVYNVVNSNFAMSAEVSEIVGWIDTIEKDYIKLKQQLTELSAERDNLANKLKISQTNEKLTSLQLQLTQEKLEEYFVSNQKKNMLLTEHCQQQKRIIHLVASRLLIKTTENSSEDVINQHKNSILVLFSDIELKSKSI